MINKYSIKIQSPLLNEFLHSNLILLTTEKEKKAIEEAFYNVLSDIDIGLETIRGVIVKDVFNTIHRLNLFFDFLIVNNESVSVLKYLDNAKMIIKNVTEYIENVEGLGYHKEYKIPTTSSISLISYKIYETKYGPWKLTLNVYGYIGIDLLTHHEREELLKKYKDSHLYTIVSSYDLLGLELGSE